MRHNLARKSHLTLVDVTEPQPLSLRAVTTTPEASNEDIRGYPLKPLRRAELSEDTRRWLSSLSIVLVVYAAPLVWWFMPDNNASSAPPPAAAMVVELAPEPVAPTAEPDTMPGPEQAETTPPPEPEPLPEPEPELPAVPPAPEPEVAVAPKPEPKPEEEPRQELPPEPEIRQEAPPQEEKPPTTASAPADAPVEHSEAAAPNQGISAPAVDSSRLLTWQENLIRQLDAAKRYPFRARRLRQEGVSYLRFTMDREGKVLAKSIGQSSGNNLLDKETLALIDRAQPLPEPPEEMQGEVLEFVVPVEFFLQR